MTAPREMSPMVIAAIGIVRLWMLSTPAISEGQSLIHACVNELGTLRIVDPGSACTSKEHLLTWPAQPGTGTVTYYYRENRVAVPPGSPRGVVAFCDDPEDTAVAGGHIWLDSHLSVPTDTAILWSLSCRASGGTCSGSAGQDGWFLVAYLPGPGEIRSIDLVVTCATP
jgi:hypothetical protein